MDQPDLGRFSDASLLILASLTDGPKHGYAIEKDVEAFSGTRLEPGTLYGALARLERRGWIAPVPTEDRRRPYRLTGEGVAVARAQLSTMRQISSLGLQRLGSS